MKKKSINKVYLWKSYVSPLFSSFAMTSIDILSIFSSPKYSSPRAKSRILYPQFATNLANQSSSADSQANEEPLQPSTHFYQEIFSLQLRKSCFNVADGCPHSWIHSSFSFSWSPFPFFYSLFYFSFLFFSSFVFSLNLINEKEEH